MSEPISLTTWQKIAITVLLAVVLWVPRGLMLNRFVAVDERSWLTRSGNFYYALSQGDFAGTFQRYHPGVTTMWLGMAGYLWQYPNYTQDAASQIADMSEGVDDFLRAHGHEPIDVLAAARAFVVIATIAVLLFAFWIAVDLFGLLAAVAAFLLIAFEPFLLGLTRMLHVDGLVSAFMFLSLLSYLRYYAGSPRNRPAFANRTRDLIISGVAAGLAWLTKSPALFLIPFMGLIALYAMWQRWRTPRTQPSARDWSHVLRPVLDGLLWLGIGAFVFVLLWPAMWVQPVESLRALFSSASDSASFGHSKALYYNGSSYLGDPGAWFYPHTFLWRISPITLIGLALGMAAWFLKMPPTDLRARRTSIAWLAIFVVSFTLFMTVGATKFPRYLLPVYMPLDLIAGIGWIAIAVWAQSVFRQHWIVPLIVGTPLIVHTLLTLATFPYYFTYYNPLLGGSKRAPQVMMIGLGEGLDEAARILRNIPDAEQKTVATWYRGGSFNYIYPYESVDIDRFYQSDYAVIYAHQWQREVPDKRLLDYFATLTPEHVVEIDGTEYARIYNLQDAPPPDYFVDWAHAIRLVGHDLLPQSVRADEPFVVRLHLLAIASIERNLSVLVRLVDENGREIGRSEGWPFGSPTSTWLPDEEYVDGHEFAVPPDTPPGYLRVEVGLYDPATQEMLAPVRASDGAALPDMVAVDYVTVEPLSTPAQTLQHQVNIGDQILLTGAELAGEPVLEMGGLNAQVEAGDTLLLTLYWHMNQYVPVDYTILLQLLDTGGQLVAQWDSQPVGGALPTTLWRSEDDIVDQHDLVLPHELPAGAYQLIAGMYDVATLERLPVSIDGEPTGDTVTLARLVLGAPK